MTVSEKRLDTLKWFAGEMLAKQEANMHKGDNWEEVGLGRLFRNLRIETEELAGALMAQDLAEVVRECADVANYCLMLADTARGLAAEREAALPKRSDLRGSCLDLTGDMTTAEYMDTIRGRERAE